MDSKTPPLFDVLTATATQLQKHLATGALTSVQVVTEYLSQIEQHNHAGAKLNAMITVAPKELALKRAEDLDRERRDGRTKGPLHGIPIIIKVKTKDIQLYSNFWILINQDCFLMGPEMGMKTTVGAYCFAREGEEECVCD